MSRVVLAMSGGVDSSVSAWLLREAGHEVIGLFMRHGEPLAPSCAATDASALLPIVSHALSHKQGCCTASDAADARRIADKLDIPFYALDFADEFGRIMDYFADEYVSGRTPNPCVMCNTWLKFGRLRDYADSVQADYLATGHYARLVPSSLASEPPALCRAGDPSKDQSYVLFGVDRAMLSRMLLPVGDFPKTEIREMARKLGLRVADKPDSQEICFVTHNDYARFVRDRRPGLDLAGEIVTTDGTVVGRHEGLERFTVGQRKGLGVAFGEPRYVVRLETESRRVVIGHRKDLERTRFFARSANWLVEPPSEAIDCCVQVRYQSTPLEARVRPWSRDRLEVELQQPKAGVAPGQAVVCYQGDRVLGGGWIE